ncbi:ATP-binding cassette domain-containing protein [Temperatibacter marinus]|uniref:ATP-binding cassette domain-containing protein n=1 Tax=Temperatibacter marinus TaxID=1456591 RepID=A0AA52ED14_9PROT|nr:ATP-binding cassette domain-containing protein [Temperatibacter marinus]WND03197.1 ATP-binding cassette domain-containing protein [Temperatibacter marinus]
MKLSADFDQAVSLYKKSVGIVSLFSFLANLSFLAMPLFMMNTYRTVIPAKSTPTLFALLALVLVIMGAYYFLEKARTIILSKAALRFEADLMGLVMAAELNHNKQSSIQSINDIQALRVHLSSSVVMSAFDLMTVPIFLFIIFYIHIGAGLVLMASIIFLSYLAIKGNAKTSPLIDLSREKNIESQKVLESFARSQENVKSMGMYKEAIAEYGAKHNEAIKTQIEMVEIQSKTSSLSKAMRQVVQILLVFTGAMLVLEGGASMGVVFAMVIIGGRAIGPVEALVGNWRQVVLIKTTYNKLKDRLSELELPEKSTLLPVPKGFVRLKQVYYAPEGVSDPILVKLQHLFESGTVTAVLGNNGAGKSTLAKVIVGYIKPSAGHATLDDQEISSWDPVLKGFYMGYMPQKVTFFNGTVRDNIARLRKDDPDHFAIDAAKFAGVHDMIMRLPKGYDTVLGDFGMNLSGGQAQLLALARAVYTKPKVLVLDEPNAALDGVGEQILMACIEKCKKENMTVIVVTQRPGLLKVADEMLVMQSGRIVKSGPVTDTMSSGNIMIEKK